MVSIQKNRADNLESELASLRQGTPDRAIIATAALQGLLANQHAWSEVVEKDYANYAIRHADALLAELNKKEQKP